MLPLLLCSPLPGASQTMDDITHAFDAEIAAEEQAAATGAGGGGDLFDRETEKYRTGSTCDPDCSRGCKYVTNCKQLCSACSLTWALCGKGGDEICACHPQAEDWPETDDADEFSLKLGGGGSCKVRASE